MQTFQREWRRKKWKAFWFVQPAKKKGGEETIKENNKNKNKNKKTKLKTNKQTNKKKKKKAKEHT